MEKVTVTGIFTWGRGERVSDRYGFFTTDRQNYNNDASAQVSCDSVTTLAALNGEQARITVRVLEARTSGHIGDFFRGLSPSTPEVGAEFDLGAGTLRVVFASWSALGCEIGLEPADGRPNDWFDPRILYQLHDQTVEVTIQVENPLETLLRQGEEIGKLLKGE